MNNRSKVIDTMLILFSGGAMTLAGWNLAETHTLAKLSAAGIEKDSSMMREITDLNSRMRVVENEVETIKIHQATIETKQTFTPKL